jgi:signal transduction histidine kinase
MIYRAVLNLVTNAIDACSESESGDLVILKSQGKPDEIVLSVEDNGIGMSDEIQSRLFTRFFSTKATGGTGLGLPVVKKITEEHGGTLRIKSELDRGSEFHIHLPRKTPER